MAGSFNRFCKWFELMRTYVERGNRSTVFYEKVSVTQRPVQIYLVLLKTCMRNPGMTIFGAVILLFLCLILSISLNIQNRKEVESDRFSIYVTMPAGSTLESADRIVQVIEERLAGFPEKQDLISRIRETDAELTFCPKRKITARLGSVISLISNLTYKPFPCYQRSRNIPFRSWRWWRQER